MTSASASIQESIQWFESHPVVGTALLGCVGYTVVSLLRLMTKSIKKRKDSEVIKPKFFARKGTFKIAAVHQFEKTDRDVSGYVHLGQNSRPDQWQRLIEVRSSFFGLRHEIIPIRSDLILTVIVDFRGKWKNTSFNK